MLWNKQTYFINPRSSIQEETEVARSCLGKTNIHLWNWENKRNIIWYALKSRGLGETDLSDLPEENRRKYGSFSFGACLDKEWVSFWEDFFLRFYQSLSGGTVDALYKDSSWGWNSACAHDISRALSARRCVPLSNLQNSVLVRCIWKKKVSLNEGRSRKQEANKTVLNHYLE